MPQAPNLCVIRDSLFCEKLILFFLYTAIMMASHKIHRGSGAEFTVEGGAKKITQMFFFILFLILLITLFCVYILEVHTLTIPKW